MLQGVESMKTGGPKSISAKYQRPKRPSDSQRPRRGGENVQWQRLKAMSMEGTMNEAVGISREATSVIGRWMLFKHLTPVQAESARRYAYIMGRFDKYFTEGRRAAKSPAYERAFGADQELERRAFEGTIGDYEKSARKARRHYDKLQKILGAYADPITGRNQMKEALDQMCCEDIEPPSEYRENMAAVLSHVGKAFDVTAQPKRGRPRKGRR